MPISTSTFSSSSKQSRTPLGPAMKPQDKNEPRQAVVERKQHKTSSTSSSSNINFTSDHFMPVIKTNSNSSTISTQTTSTVTSTDSMKEVGHSSFSMQPARTSTSSTGTSMNRSYEEPKRASSPPKVGFMTEPPSWTDASNNSSYEKSKTSSFSPKSVFNRTNSFSNVANKNSSYKESKTTSPSPKSVFNPTAHEEIYYSSTDASKKNTYNESKTTSPSPKSVFNPNANEEIYYSSIDASKKNTYEEPKTTSSSPKSAFNTKAQQETSSSRSGVNKSYSYEEPKTTTYSTKSVLNAKAHEETSSRGVSQSTLYEEPKIADASSMKAHKDKNLSTTYGKPATPVATSSSKTATAANQKKEEAEQTTKPPVPMRTVSSTSNGSSSKGGQRCLPSASLSLSKKNDFHGEDIEEERSVASRDPPGSRVVPTTITVATEPSNKEEETIVSSEDCTKEKEAAQFYHQEQYGLEGNPAEENARPTADVERRYAQALCSAIGSEGVYTSDQEDWIIGLLSSKGYQQSVVDAVPTMLKEAAKLLELELVVESKHLITEDMRKESTLLIYDMYRAASVADFPNEQMCAIAMIAEEIGVDQFGHLEGIRKQVVAEIELKKQRIKLLYPEGHELLDEQYEDLVPSPEGRGSDESQRDESNRSHSSGNKVKDGNSGSGSRSRNSIASRGSRDPPETSYNAVVHV